MIYWELIFVYGMRLGLCIGYPIVPASVAKKIILSLLNYIVIFVKTQLTMYVCVYFWILHSILSIMFSFIPIQPCTDYYIFITNFEIR